METFANILVAVDDFVWGPVMLILLVGTGIFLTIRTKALCWRNLPYALSSVLSKEARQKKGTGDVSPFSALTTALAATIGTGNIVGVATAMVSGGPGALLWMWLSAAFGLTSKFAECMLAIKYREVNAQGEMSGGPMYTMKKGFKNKKLGAVLGWLFAFFAVIASFGIGNLTQANSISSALHTTFGVPAYITGIIITLLALLIILGGIKSISKVSQIVVPVMALFYMICGFIIIIGHISNVPSGVAMIFRMAFSLEAVGGGLCGSLVTSMSQAMRFGVARGVFSNEAGMGSAAITAAAATTDDPVRQGYINMTGTFWDTIVVCTITGLCIASSGVLGSTAPAATGTYYLQEAENRHQLAYSTTSGEETSTGRYDMAFSHITPDNNVSVDAEYNVEVLGDASSTDQISLTLVSTNSKDQLILYSEDETIKQNYIDYYFRPDSSTIEFSDILVGTWHDRAGNEYIFGSDGEMEKRELVTGAALTIAAFKTILGEPGGWLVCIGIALFAFSTILGWEYHGEKAFEYILNTHRFNMIYRIFFSLIVFLGATTTLEIAWNFSDIANALMAIPNLICLLALSGVVAEEMERFQEVIKKERRS